MLRWTTAHADPAQNKRNFLEVSGDIVEQRVRLTPRRNYFLLVIHIQLRPPFLGPRLVVTSEEGSVFERELAGGNRSFAAIQARLSNSCWREPLHSAVEASSTHFISSVSATDPADKTVPLVQQTGFVDKMRQMGRLVSEFMVEATDKSTMSWSSMHN